jgi:hypothetical protein
LRSSTHERHHEAVFRKREQLVSREEVNGVILLLMSIDEELRRLVRTAENGYGEARE